MALAYLSASDSVCSIRKRANTKIAPPPATPTRTVINIRRFETRTAIIIDD
jgi:hypothetical protein